MTDERRKRIDRTPDADTDPIPLAEPDERHEPAERSERRTRPRPTERSDAASEGPGLAEPARPPSAGPDIEPPVLPESPTAIPPTAGLSETDKLREAVDVVHCRQHPDRLGKWWCHNCQKPVCRDCVTIDEDQAAGRPVAFCKTCQRPCKINKSAKLRDEDDTRPFLARLGQAFAYPIQGHNWAILTVLTIVVGGTAALGVYYWLILITFLPFLMLLLIPWVYDILSESARGSREMPPVPVPSDPWDDLLRPAFLLIAAVAVTFAPAIFVQWWVTEQTAVLGPMQPVLAPLLWIAGLALMPMTLLVAVLFETPLAIRPTLVFGGIARMVGDYLVLLVLLALIPLVALGAVAILNVLPFLPITILLTTFVELYLLALNMHLIGQLYHANRQKLAWFVG